MDGQRCLLVCDLYSCAIVPRIKSHDRQTDKQTHKQTNKQTDEQMDSTDALHRSRCRERRLNNMKLVHCRAVDGWTVTFGTARSTELGGAAAHPGPSSLYQM